MQDLFRVTPLDHIWSAQIPAQIQPNTPKYGKSIWALEGFGQSLFASGNYFYKKDFDGPFHTNVFSELGGLGQCRVGDDEVEVLWWRPDENVAPLLVTW